MSNGISKFVADKLVASRALRTAGEVHAKVIADGVERWLFGAERPRKVSIEELVELVYQRLATDERALESAERAYQAELGDDALPRDRRDQAVIAIRASLISASELVRGAHGVAYSRLVGLEAPLAERDDQLVHQARSAGELLRKTAPTTKPRDGVTLERVALGKSLQNDADILSAALESVQREEKEGHQARLLRDHADAQLANSYGNGGGMLESLARVGGQPEIGDRMKVTERRRAGVPDDGEQPGGGGPPAVDPTGGGEPTT